MLILARKKDESIMIGDNIEITVLDIQGDQVKIGIKAPKSVTLHRKEVYIEISAENMKAVIGAEIKLDMLKNAMNKNK